MPHTTKARPRQRPKVCRVSGPMWSSGCTPFKGTPRARGPGSEVAGRVHRLAVDARLEVHVGAEAVARAAAVADDLALAHARPDRRADARLVAVAGRQRARVLDAGV